MKIKRKRTWQVSYTEQYVHKINERMTWRRMAANPSMIPLNSECDPPGETCSRPIRSQKEQEWGADGGECQKGISEWWCMSVCACVRVCVCAWNEKHPPGEASIVGLLAKKTPSNKSLYLRIFAIVPARPRHWNSRLFLYFRLSFLFVCLPFVILRVKLLL